MNAEITDMRKPGEAFCADCPDHEACMTNWPCSLVKRVDRAAVSEPTAAEWKETALKFSDDYHAELNRRIAAEQKVAAAIQFVESKAFSNDNPTIAPMVVFHLREFRAALAHPSTDPDG